MHRYSITRGRGYGLAVTMLTASAILTAHSRASAQVIVYVSLDNAGTTGSGTIATLNSATSPPTVATIATGLTNPAGMSFDSAGNLYVSNTSTNTVSKIAPGGSVSTFASNLGEPESMAFDPSGNLYVAAASANTIWKITPGGSVSTFATAGLSGPVGLARDTAGNIWAANQFNGTIEKFSPDGLSHSVFASGLGSLDDLVFDSSGNLYASDANGFGSNSGYVLKYTNPSGGVSSNMILSGLNNPANMAFDSAGDFYLANLGGTITEIAAGGTVSTFDSGLGGPNGIAIAPTAIPEPSSLLLVAGTVAVALGVRRRQWLTRRRSSAMLAAIATAASSILAADSRASAQVVLYVSIQNGGRTRTGAVATLNSTTSPPTVGTYATGLSGPVGMAFDSGGNLYVSNATANTVSKIAPGGSVSTFASNLVGEPESMVVDPSGNLYVAGGSGDAIWKITPAGTVSTFATAGLSGPVGLARDAAGNIWVANHFSGTIERFTPDGLSYSIFASGLGILADLAFDPSGNLYVSDFGTTSGFVLKYTNPSDGVSPSTILTGLDQPLGMAFDAAGNFYLANAVGGTIMEIPAGGSVTTLASGLNEPSAIAILPTGVPEPSSLLLATAAATAGAVLCRRKRISARSGVSLAAALSPQSPPAAASPGRSPVA